ncbi:hypothetical protein GTP27_23140 [Pseudoduganella sp. CY13W]|uniref:HNH nuclease domain-containing protein n=2 Tax=Duganella qianjiadongensis TaxID=2692176 RepID=A0ABW9VSZ1_9BURK|nr:HNH endonuclease signature motif containing protein [Duganella qianjiadongensis]MYM42195.1 hypothetical protein [Duganella qianjiadongensis]
MKETMPHPTLEDWLSTLKRLRSEFAIEPDNYETKSPTFKCGGWRVGIEHQRKFESVVIRWMGDFEKRPAPQRRWIPCPSSDREKKWEYRVYTRPEQLPTLLNELLSDLQTIEDINHELAERVAKAMSDTSHARQARLLDRSRRPLKIMVTATVFDRNPDVVAEVLYRSQGICEHCYQPAPFNRRSNGSPYLEVHHIVRLADGGDDTVENAVALCPNCHRKVHYA